MAKVTINVTGIEKAMTVYNKRMGKIIERFTKAGAAMVEAFLKFGNNPTRAEYHFRRVLTKHRRREMYLRRYRRRGERMKK
jgi:hypothetical protein